MKLSKASGGVGLLALLLMPSMAAAQFYSDVQDNGPLHLRGQGSFFMQGNAAQVDRNAQAGTRAPGLVQINQMHVQFMKPLAQNGKKHYSLVLYPGGGLTSKVYDTTPDGRMGWYEYFVRKGFDTYLAESITFGRSGFDARKYNMVRNGALPPPDQGAITILTDQVTWGFFRGSVTPCTVSPCYATTQPIPGGQFPVQTLGIGNSGANQQAAAQIVPNMLSTLPNTPIGCDASICNPPASDAGVSFPPSYQLAKLATQLDGAILFGHSQSSTYPARAALQPDSGCYPWTSASACKVKGIIQAESGCFTNLTPAQLTTLAHIPILVIGGDNPNGTDPTISCQAQMNQINAAGGDMRISALPKLTPGSLYPGSPGPITGNGHMIMWDKNSLQIADIFIGWINSRGL